MLGILDFVREQIGQPVGLVRLFEKHPDARITLDPPKSCIDVRSVVRWHELGESSHSLSPHGERGTLIGWTARGGYDYGSFTLHRPEYAQFGRSEITDDWGCDIADVHGFSSSKSNLHEFISTDQMVETNSREMIDEVTHEKLAQNLAHHEIRIIHSPGSDFFSRFAWDGRNFLINGGGSHHLASAKYIATRLQQPVALRGKLYKHSLNSHAIASLRRDYEMFVISDEPSISNGFHDAMKAFSATWLWHRMPQPFENSKAILLPKNESRSIRVASILRQAGLVDLGQHLTEIATKTPSAARSLH
ncbi:MAG: DUF6685 family protein [Casimicrobium sp.]